MDEEAAFSELEALETTLNIETAEIHKILCNAQSRGKIVKFGNIDIRVKPGMPDVVRDLLLDLQKAFKRVIPEGDEEEAKKRGNEIQSLVYEIIANLCVDAPYTNPLLWKYLDQKTGVADGFMKELLEDALGFAEALRKFR